MTNGRRKHGKHSAALPETQPAGARETEAKTVIMTHRELEEKFATKEELKQSKKFLVEKTKHEKQLHSQELRSVETNLTQKIDSNEARAEERMADKEARDVERFSELRSDMNRQFEASEANLTQIIEAHVSNLTQKVEASETNLTQKIDANEKRVDEFRSDVNEQFKDSDARNVKSREASEARIIEKLNEFKSEVFKHFAIKEKFDEESKKNLKSTLEQQSEKNLYKTAFLVVVIGASLSALVYGLYRLAMFFIGGS